MSEDTLPAPVPAEDAEPDVQPALVQDVSATTAADDQSQLDNSFNRTVRHLAAQPLVRIRIPKEAGYETVKINGWYAKYAWTPENQGVHMVP